MEPKPTERAAATARVITIPRVLVATTAMLTFISFWRAAAIVLNDLASSAYYAGGDAERYIGKTAPMENAPWCCRSHCFWRKRSLTSSKKSVFFLNCSTIQSTKAGLYWGDANTDL